MKQKNITFEKKYKSTISLLHKYIVDNKKRKKPLIPHLLRIGEYLHKNNYSEDIVNAGLLHDIIEWTNIPKNIIIDKFGKHVYNIVLANTKNRNVKDPIERRIDYINKCTEIGIDALIVKTADTLDSYAYYKKKNNLKEIKRCKNIAQLILKKIDEEKDPIFKKLKNIM